MLNIYARSFLTASRFTSSTRVDPATEQRLEKRRGKPSTDTKQGFRPRFWI